MKHTIRQYRIDQGALEVEYIEDCFQEFSGKKKTAAEIAERLRGREHLILLSMAASPDDPRQLIPVAYKVGHELRLRETDPKLVELVEQLKGQVVFTDRKIFYSWIGGTREQWRGQGHYRALSEQQEEWALRHSYNEIVVKTKNRFYSMRAALDHLRFNIVRFQIDSEDNAHSKVFLSKVLGKELLKGHRTTRTVEAF
jgi:GNAT superfamily N-acetyltransferase